MRHFVVSRVDARAAYPSFTPNDANSSISTIVLRSPRPTSPVVDSPSMTLPYLTFPTCIDVRFTSNGLSHLGWCASRKSIFQKRLLGSFGAST